MSEDDEELPRLLGGRYRLEAVLGHGGMGVVYRGSDLMMKRSIAVKLIRAIHGVELDDEVAGRFLREAKNTARLQHPHIVQVYDLGRTNEGALYLVMELLEGESLSGMMRRRGPLPPDEVVHIVCQIADALEVAHRANVVHRDLKPANVMLLQRGGNDAFVKVLDFGVAKSYTPDQQTALTQLGMLVGTVDYMAPEQIMGKRLDGRADVYSLGIVLYKMLSGKAPFGDAAVPALIHAHLNVDAPPIAEVASGLQIPAALEHVVLRCLSKEPEQRYGSMAELANALGDALAVSEDDARAELVDPPTEPRDGKNPYAGEAPGAGRPAEGEGEFGFDAGTRKMDRTLGFKKAQVPARAALPMTPRIAKPRRDPAPRIPHVDVLRPERAASKKCVMCSTINPPYQRACIACGVSLAREDQAALAPRVRPGAPPPAREPTAPQARASGNPPPLAQITGPVQPLPAAITGPLPLPFDAPITGPLPPMTRPSSNPPSHAPSHLGPGVAQPYDRISRQPLLTGPHLPPQWSEPTPGDRQRDRPQPSMWDRFLTWTGLRSR